MPRVIMDRRRQEPPSCLPPVWGVGVDCEQVSRFESVDSTFEKKVFTKGEIGYCRSRARPAQHFAARFAAKEAVAKSLGSLGRKITLDRIEVLRFRNGAPRIKILDSGFGGYEARISIAHSGDMAIAFALVTRK